MGGGSVTANVAGNTFFVDWHLAYQNIDQNFSVVTWQAGAILKYHYGLNAVRIDGGQVGGVGIGNGTWSNIGSGRVTLRNGERQIYHDANGNCSFYVDINGWTYGGGNGSSGQWFPLPRIAKAPDIAHLIMSSISPTEMELRGEIMNYGRGTSATLQTQIVKSGDGWSSGGWQNGQVDAYGDNVWRVNGLKPNTDYSARLKVWNNNGDTNVSGEHKFRTKGDSYIVRHENLSSISTSISLKTSPTSGYGGDVQTGVDYYYIKNGQKVWGGSERVHKVGEYKIVLKNLKPNTTYYAQTVVTNSGGEYRCPIYTFKTLPSCVIIKSSGEVVNAVPQIIKSDGAIVPIDFKTI